MPQIITAALFIACFFLFVRRRASVEKSAKAQNFVCLMTGVFSLLFVLFILDGGNNWGGDFSEYIAQARAIVTGTIDVQVRNNAYIIENSPPFLGDVVYPWGFPFLLAPFYALFGKNLFFLKLPVLLCFFFSVLLCNLLFRKHFSFFQAELATLFVAVNPTLIFFCNQPLSDVPFLCFSLMTLILCEALFFSADKKTQLLAGTGGAFPRSARL